MTVPELDLFLRVSLLGLTLLLAVLTLLAYSRVRSTKLLLIGLGFMALTAKASLLVLGIFDPAIYRSINIPTELLLLDFLAVALLYAGTTVR